MHIPLLWESLVIGYSSIPILTKESPHITTEVDYESLFSQAGNQSLASSFERSVMEKYHMPRTYYCKKKVVKATPKKERL